MQRPDVETDVVVVGSGAAGTVAALTAKAAGYEAIILEKSEVLGGSTALSGGGMWAPGNRFMSAAGNPDSTEDILKYFDHTVNDDGLHTSKQRRTAFVYNINRALDFLEEEGLQLRAIDEYPDYYPELPGARPGRGVEPKPFDVNKLGDWSSKLPPRIFPRTLPLSTAVSAKLYLAKRTLSGFLAFAELMLRHYSGQLMGRKEVGLG